MKKSIVIIALILNCFGIKAIAAGPDDCYLKTADKFYSGKDIKMGFNHTKIIYSDGTFTEVPNRDITAYRHHGKVYMLMPVICDKNDTLCLAMMEYISSKKGFSVYRYRCCDKDFYLYDPGNIYRNIFFVYKDGKFYQRIEEEQTEALKSFSIKVI
jgi:hypothetical protein